MKNGIIALVVIALVIIILIFTYKIVKNINAQKEVDALYATHKRNKMFIIRVLDAAFGKGKILKAVRIPVRTNSGLAEPATADALMVTRAGIIIINIFGAAGKLDNPQNAPWRLLDKSGRVTTYENPFKKNQYMIEVLKKILRKDGFHNITFHSLVIIANSDGVLPKYTYRDMISEKNILEEIKSITIEKQLSFTEIQDVQATVRKNLIPSAKPNFETTATHTLQG